MPQGCYSCEREEEYGGLPPREHIASDTHWRVAHAIGTSLPGWLVLLPRRHVTAVHELTDAEAGSLGLWQVRLSRALRESTGCEKTYVVQFAEQAGFSHVHFHVVPRAADLAPELRGGKIFDLLGRPAAECLTDQAADEVALAVRARLEMSGRR
ncbi:HIT family protein [Streptomyces beijiangensis]|uniref:HIT family protein n=1 Tax=Streptomyces beijiangensis TaxID=163361 RepID=A0A939F878_9ACTN|nr:HIT family protein [Streptomyces beijiangensis]